MIVETDEVLKRYEISLATLGNKREIIKQQDGIILGNGGSSKNLYKTSVLDALAREGKLGSKPRKAILNLDQRKETA